MKKFSIPSFFRRTAALVLAAALALPTVYADAGQSKLQTTTEIVDGLTFRNTVTENKDQRVESFSLELEPHSDASPILLQGSDTIYGAATINKAVSTAQSKGYHVLGAINTDFFSVSTGVPMGIVVENGVYKSSNANGTAMLITDGVVSIQEDPQVSLTLTNLRTEKVTVPSHFNKTRTATGGMYLMNRDFSSVSTRTTTPGWSVRMKVTGDRPGDPWTSPDDSRPAPQLTVNSTLTMEVTEMVQSDQPLVIGPGEYILTCDNAAARQEDFLSFQVGDRILLTTSTENEALSEAQWAGGVGDIMIRDGAITDSSKWTYAKDGKAPRTALGMLEDGTLLLYAVDGRRKDYSAGLTQMDLAEELLKQGCQWAVNLDGGGSTAISVWLPGQTGPAIRSLPSDGKPRPCATYLLLVGDQKGDGQPDRLALKEDGITVLAGSSFELSEAAVLDDGLNVLNVPAEDVTYTSEEGLGHIEGGIYTAGTTPGTDTILLHSSDLRVHGTAQVHVVDSLTDFRVSRAGSKDPLTSLSLKPGEAIQLDAAGSYWNRTALYDLAPVVWSIKGGIGSVDANGLFTASDEGGTGSITATAGGKSITIPFTSINVHNDVGPGHWAYNAVEYCYSKGIVSGVSPTEYGRDLPIQRADFILMLYSALGRPAPKAPAQFGDVFPTDYYFDALSWGQGVGLASGMGGGLFAPHASITREQAFTILRQAMPLLGKDCPDASLSVLDSFSDKDKIADYAKGHTATLVAQGVVSGKGTCIDPKGLLTRAEMAVLLHKIMTYTPILDVPTDPVKPVEPVEPTPTPTPDPEPQPQPKPDPVPNPEPKPEPPAPQPKPEPKPEPQIPEEKPSDGKHTISLNLKELTLNSGDSVALAAAIDPAVADAKITWKSSSPNSAAVSPDGVVTNLFAGVGTPAVTITASWNGLTARCTVVCQQPDQVGIIHDAELGLNVRTGPGSSYPVCGSLANSTRVLVLGESGGWYQIMYLNLNNQAAVGYVSGDYLRVSK